MNVWVFLGSLFILVCVCAVVYAICKLVSIVDETRDRTEALARITVKEEKKVAELNDDQINLAEKIYSDSAEIAALHDHFDELKENIKTNSLRISVLTNLCENQQKRMDELSVLDGAYTQLLMRIDDLEKKLEKGGAQIERKTGHAKSES